MPLKKIAFGNRTRTKPITVERDGSIHEKNFDSLRSELFMISDKHKMFNLTWHQIMAVIVFTCSVVVLVLLKI